MQQVWAQIAQAWREGERHPLTRAEMDRLHDANDAHTETSAIEELLASKYDWSDLLRPHSMTATEALLALWHGERGGSLLRIELAEAAPLGRKRGWKAAYPVIQWSVTR